jgi:hypothetical protein
VLSVLKYGFAVAKFTASAISLPNSPQRRKKLAKAAHRALPVVVVSVVPKTIVKPQSV